MLSNGFQFKLHVILYKNKRDEIYRENFLIEMEKFQNKQTFTLIKKMIIFQKYVIGFKYNTKFYKIFVECFTIGCDC